MRLSGDMIFAIRMTKPCILSYQLSTQQNYQKGHDSILCTTLFEPLLGVYSVWFCHIKEAKMCGLRQITCLDPAKFMNINSHCKREHFGLIDYK